MIRTALRGLRGRLLLSLVATSAVTLLVAAAITLGPLQSRLRDESKTALQQATSETRFDFGDALDKTAKRKADEDEVGRQQRRAIALGNIARDLRDRTNGARVMVTDLTLHRRHRRERTRISLRHRLPDGRVRERAPARDPGIGRRRHGDPDHR